MAIAPSKTIQDVIAEFLGSAPTAEEIIAFEFPHEIQRRGLDLLERNRQGMLTPLERDELDEFSRLGHLMNMITLHARLNLAGEE